MKELLDKLSSYNLFNYLMPGTVFVAVMERTSAHRFHDDNIVIALFSFYFIGLVISRLGSLVVEPIFKQVGIIKFAPWADYFAAARRDPKIDILVEQTNVFRTCSALCLALLGVRATDFILWHLHVSQRVTLPALLVALFILFSVAYWKQNNYVNGRVDEAKNCEVATIR